MISFVWPGFVLQLKEIWVLNLRALSKRLTFERTPDNVYISSYSLCGSRVDWVGRVSKTLLHSESGKLDCLA